MSASMNPVSDAGGDTFEMVIVVEPNHKDVVLTEFNKPVKRFFIPPDVARAVAEKYARCAYAAQFGDTPTTQGRSAITDQKIATLRLRVKKMLQGMEGQDYAIQANAIVDVMLTEVV